MRGEINDVNVKSDSGDEEPSIFSDRNDYVTGDESNVVTEVGMEMEKRESTAIVKVDDLKVKYCIRAPGMVFKPWNDQKEEWESEEEKNSSAEEERPKFFSFNETKEDKFKVEEESEPEPEDLQDQTHSQSTPLAASTSKKRRLNLPRNTGLTAQVEHQRVRSPPGQSSFLNCFPYSLKREEVDDKPCDASHSSANQLEKVEESSPVMDDQFSYFQCPNSKFQAKKSWIAEITSIHRDLNFNIDARQASKLRLDDFVLPSGKCEPVLKSESLVKADLEINHTE